MKIWLLTSETPFFNPGGIARYIDNFARYLAAEGHEVTVFGRDDQEREAEPVPGYRYRSVVPKWDLCGEQGPSLEADQHPAYPYNVLDYWGAFSYQMAEAVLAEIKTSGPPDVIESQEYTALPYYLLQRKLTERGPLETIPIVVNAHSPDFIIREENEEPRYQFPHYWTGRLELFCLRAADACICPSNYLARQLEDRFGDSISVTAFHLPWTDPGEMEAPLPGEAGRVLYFGRLEVRKGTLELVDACARLWKRGQSFELHLIGADTRYFPRDDTVGGWIRKRYGRWIDSGRLHLRESMDHAHLMKEVRMATCTVVPSRWENWPNTCIEAMSMGKVVVASANGGQAEMLGDDGACGFVYDTEDPEGLARSLRMALSLSPETRVAMGRIARERIASLCAPEVVLPQRLQHFASLGGPVHQRLFPFTNRHLRNDRARRGWRGDAGEPGLVSVVIPHYNLGKYLPSTVEAATRADWDQLEIILVDDGSTDPDSREMVDRLESEGPANLRVIRKENGGLASARNRGAEEANGEFLMLLDADDLFEPSFVSRAVDVLRRYENVHIVYSWERYIEASEDVFPCWNFEFPYLLGHNMTCPISLMYRQSYLTYGPSKRAMAYNFEDFELWINLVKAGCGGVALVDPLSFYRIRRDSMWQGSAREQHLFLQDRIARFHPDLYAAYGTELFCLQNANGSAQKWVKPSGPSPYDAFAQWSGEHIAGLEAEAKKWWLHSVEVEKKLSAAEKEKYELWTEKNRIEAELLKEREKGTTHSS